MRDEITGNADEIWSSACGPFDGTCARAVAARERRAEVKVGEVSDPDAIQLLGEPGHGDLHNPGPKPARLEPAVDREREGGARESH